MNKLRACVLDTSVVNFRLNGLPEWQLYDVYLGPDTIEYVSLQTVAELRFGALNRNLGPNRMRRLQEFVDGAEAIETSPELMKHWVEIMYEAKRSGRRLEVDDAWIAATARLLDVPLMTHDADFANIPGLGITVISLP